jgi:glycosyltransferase involved in cell wall biosynthesis
MNQDKPLISIITVCLNSEKTIEETILSVLNQTYENIEYIIIDGGSLDGTKKIIDKYKDKISYYISEKDEGLYFAFNKGINLVKGQMFGFVNSDDILLPGAIETLVKYYNKNNNIDFIFGSVKKHWGILHGYRPWKIKYSWGFYSSHSTGFFIKTLSANKIGYYNTKYKYSADYDYFYRAIVTHKLKGIATKKDEVFGIFRRGGFSSKVNFLAHLFEEMTIRIDNKQSKVFVLLLFIHKFIKNINKI